MRYLQSINHSVFCTLVYDHIIIEVVISNNFIIVIMITIRNF